MNLIGPNPYDFANPVSDAALFAGRLKELEEITYYLDHAKTAPRPMNLALLGPRASGKTSTLNMTEVEALKRGFCTVRINLDEDDAKSELLFFLKLFDATFTAACEANAFGGVTGKTYDTYLDMVNAFSVPEDKTFCPFLFPIQYAKAMAAGHEQAPVFDHNLRHDLLSIRKEINRPLVLLFDEANVLAKSRVHLEKLRNLFMNTPGFLLVLTGTPDLFPVMDDVFSPIVRQFKKITMGNFADSKETRECIKRPLEKLGPFPVDDLFDFRDFDAVEEIHELSGGRPYEVQLICHMLFRRVQTGRAAKMRLDLSVLEDVRRELETSQDINARPILTRIRSLSSQDLAALNTLCSSTGYATFEQLWSIEYLMNGTSRYTKERLRSFLDIFVEAGILEEKEGIIEFRGDDFDRIYTKYVAREQKVPLSISEYPLEILWEIRLARKIRSRSLQLRPLILGSSDVQVDVVQLAEKLADENNATDLFVESRMGMHALYDMMIEHHKLAEVHVLVTQVSFPWLRTLSVYYPGHGSGAWSMELLESRLQPLRVRATELGWEFTYQQMTVPIADAAVLSAKLKRSANERLREAIRHSHTNNMAAVYLEKGDLDEALFLAELADGYSGAEVGEGTVDQGTANNIGYIFMVAGLLDKARALFEESLDVSDRIVRGLARYNLGIVDAKSGNMRSGSEWMLRAVAEIEGAKDCRVACLLVPERVGELVEFKERKDVDLRETAETSAEVLKAGCASGP